MHVTELPFGKRHEGGINVIATAHARDMDDLSRGSLRELLQDGLFEYVFVLSERPGNIGAIWKRNAQKWYRQILKSADV